MDKYEELETNFNTLYSLNINPLYLPADFRTGKTTFVGKYASKNPNTKVVYCSPNRLYSKNTVDLLSNMYNLTNLKSFSDTNEADVVFIEYPNTLEFITKIVNIYPNARICVFMQTTSQMLI